MQSCGVLIVKDGLILAVNRKKTSDANDDWNLPFGKKDFMDTSEEFTATRELCEETGVLVDPDRLIYLYEEKNIAKYTKNTKGATQTINTHTISNDITFLALEWNDSKIKKETKEGTVSWVTKEQLLAGSFARYNDEVLKAYQHYIGGRQTRIDEIEMAVFRNNCT